MGGIAVTLPLPPSVPQRSRGANSGVVLMEEAQRYGQSVTRLLGGQQVPTGVPVHVSARLYTASATSDLEQVATTLLAGALGFTGRQVRELHLFHTYDPAGPRAEVRVLWNALPWHCAWCEPMPSARATSGICDYHREAVLAAAGCRTAPARVA
jgi:hypothetical protein